MDTDELGGMFEGYDHGQRIACFLGFTEENETVLKVDRLAEREFEAGLRALEQAGRSQVETVELLREARQRFNLAIPTEASLRLAWAHISLSFCHSGLGDGDNAYASLLDVLEVEEYVAPEGAADVIGEMGQVGGAALIGSLLLTPIGLGFIGLGAAGMAARYMRKQRIAELQQQTVELRLLKTRVRHYLEEIEGRPAELAHVEAVPEPAAKVVVFCTRCDRVACVPTGRGRLRVTCPGCGDAYEVET